MKKLILLLSIVFASFISNAQIEIKSVANVANCTYVAGKFGNAINFGPTVSTAFVECTGIVTGQNYSMSFWIKTAQTNQGIIANLGQNINIGVNSNKIRLAYSGVSYSGLATISDNSWHYIAATFSTLEGVKVWVDGTIDIQTTIGFPVAGANGMTIGSASGSLGFKGLMDDLAIYTGIKWDSINVPVVPTSQISMSEVMLTSITRFESDITDPVDASVNVLPNNAAVLYSPFNWAVTSSSAIAINSGSYFKIQFTGSTITLKFDTRYLQAPYPQIYTKIDGYELSIQRVQINPTNGTIIVNVPTDIFGLTHILEVGAKMIPSANPKWYGLSSAIRFKGFIIPNGQTVSKPLSEAKLILEFGDSILEQSKVLNATDSDEGNRGDGTLGWGANLRYLGAEVGTVGVPSSGVVKGGLGSIPACKDAWNFVYYKSARSFTTPFDLCIINLGTNDTGNIATAFTGLLNNLLTSCPSGKIVVLRPFNGSQAANLQNGIAACSDPSRVYWIDTTGWLTATVDGVHPTAWSSEARLSILLRQAIKNLGII